MYSTEQDYGHIIMYCEVRENVQIVGYILYVGMELKITQQKHTIETFYRTVQAGTI